MTPSLKALDDLGYVLECVAEGYFGDAKSALSLLCDRMQSEPAYGVADSGQTLAALRYALSCFLGDGNRREGVQIVCRTHRNLWSAVNGV